jgi:hypothetical protein
MFKVTSDGDLSFVSESLRIFSDSSERDFMVYFRTNKDCSVLFVLRDKTVWCNFQYCALEINVKFLPDFFVDFDLGDFCFEISNTTHHEEV